MAGETYLPPVVVEFTATSKPFSAVLATVNAQLADFAKRTTETHLGADSQQFQDRIALAKTELLSLARVVTKAKIGADEVPFWSAIAVLRRTFDAMSPLQIDIEANLATAFAQMAALRGNLASSQVGGLLDSFARGMVGRAAGGAAGGGAGGGGLLKALGWGGGLGGMAAFGSILSLLGFGAEHVLATGLGVGGSLMGGMLGGGLLGLGSLGVAGVGMGTNMAGMGQAAGDIRKVEQAQNALNQAMVTYRYDVAHYGASSAAAASALQNLQAAQANLNFTLGQVPAVARGAVLAAANTIQQFKALFDKLTGPAEKLGANIIQQAVKVGEDFLPTIGKYAAANMGIIEKSLNSKGGLFSWLKSSGSTGGLGIFKDLEHIFTGDLPTAMHAITQGIELFAKTVDVAAHYTGPFLQAINHFLTKENTSGFSKWAAEIGKLIGLFRAWLGFLIAVGRTIFDIFKPAVGLGKDVALALTGILKQVDTWLTKTSTAKTMHGLFSAHAAELIKGFGGVLEAVLPLVEGFAVAFMKAATVGAEFVTLALKPLAAILRLIGAHPLVAEILGWVGVFALARSSVVGFLGTLGKMFPFFGRFMTSIAEMAAGLYAQVAAWVADAAAATAAFVAENAATIGIVAGLALLVAAAIYVGTHWHQVWHAVSAVFSAVWHFIRTHIDLLAGLLLGPFGFAVAYVATHWHQVWGDVKAVAADVWHFIRTHIDLLAGLLLGPFGFAVAYVATHWHQVWGDVKAVAADVWHFLDNDVLHPIINFFTGVWDKVVSGVKSAWHDLWHAISDAVSFAWGIISPIFNLIVGGIKAIAGIWHDVTGLFSGSVAHHGGTGPQPFGVQNRYATGGLAVNPQIAMLAENGPELVLNQRDTKLVMGARRGGYPTGGASVLGGGASYHIEVKAIQIFAPSGSAAGIKSAAKDAGEEFAKQTLISLRAGAGGVYG